MFQSPMYHCAIYWNLKAFVQFFMHAIQVFGIMENVPPLSKGTSTFSSNATLAIAKALSQHKNCWNVTPLKMLVQCGGNLFM